jgi:hypothetical protein
MDPHADSPTPTVSNLVASWGDALDGGGSFEPAAAATVVEQVVHAHEERRSEPRAHLVSPPEQFEAPRPALDRPIIAPELDDRPSAFSYVGLEEPEPTWAERRVGVMSEVLASAERDEDDLPVVDYDVLQRRDIAKELLRARLVAIAEQRELRSAYEIVFILLAAAVAVLLAAPPLVQVLLAANGVQA